MRFGAKASLFNVPFFGSALRIAENLKIERDKRDKVIRLYKESIPTVHSGLYYCLAPEGTRNINPQLAPFKSGPFLFALSGELPIYPLVLKHIDKALSKKDWLINSRQRHVTVELQCLDPVSSKGYSQKNLSELKSVLFNAMQSTYDSTP